MKDNDPMRWHPTVTYVYFIICDKFVKIGSSSRPQVRLNSIQVGNPLKCRLKGTIKLSSKSEAVALEEMLQKRFSHLNVRGEWFKYNHEIMDYLR